MRVMVLVKATSESEADAFDPAWTAAKMRAIGRFNDELRAAGILIMAEGMTARAHGKRIAFDGVERHVGDGPFTPTEGLVAGFWLWQVGDLDQAVAWVKRCPNPMPVPSVIEIRPLHG